MKKSTMVGAALTAEVVVLGIGATGTGVAFAATPKAETAPAIEQMDQMMARMLQDPPVDQQAAATAMHEQMRPAMREMMSGEMGAKGPMDEHHGETPGG